MTGIFGVTGLPCAGKSVAAHLLAQGVGTGTPGILVKADDIGHRVLETPEVLDQLVRRFGPDVATTPDAATRRRIIAEKAFANPDDLSWLENLVHPMVYAESEKIIEKNRNAPVVVETALLFAGRLGELCGIIVLIEADRSVRIARAAARGWTRDELFRREERQIPLYAPHILAGYAAKLVRVGNDEDDDGLAARLCAALERHAHA